MIKLLTLIALAAFAHEGHDDGPVGIAVGRYGGLVETIVSKSDKDHAHDAKPLGKAELVRSSDGTTRVYIYDVNMKKVDLATLSPKGYAIAEWGKSSSEKFELVRSKKSYIGKLPKLKPPFALEIYLKHGETEIFAEFENLD